MHNARGHEALGAGASGVLRQNDYVYIHHRGQNIGMAGADWPKLSSSDEQLYMREFTVDEINESLALSKKRTMPRTVMKSVTYKAFSRHSLRFEDTTWMRRLKQTGTE